MRKKSGLRRLTCIPPARWAKFHEYQSSPPALVLLLGTAGVVIRSIRRSVGSRTDRSPHGSRPPVRSRGADPKPLLALLPSERQKGSHQGCRVGVPRHLGGSEAGA